MRRWCRRGLSFGGASDCSGTGVSSFLANHFAGEFRSRNRRSRVSGGAASYFGRVTSWKLNGVGRARQTWQDSGGAPGGCLRIPPSRALDRIFQVMLTFIRFVVMIGVVVTGLKQSQRHKADAAVSAVSSEVERASEFSVVPRPAPLARGFMAAPTPINMPSGKVLIVAPACGNEADRKANDLGRRLLRAGIPFARTAELQFGKTGSQAETARIQSVVSQPLPLVFVRVRVQSNPTPEELMAEIGVRR